MNYQKNYFFILEKYQTKSQFWLKELICISFDKVYQNSLYLILCSTQRTYNYILYATY